VSLRAGRAPRARPGFSSTCRAGSGGRPTTRSRRSRLGSRVGPSPRSGRCSTRRAPRPSRGLGRRDGRRVAVPGRDRSPARDRGSGRGRGEAAGAPVRRRLDAVAPVAVEAQRTAAPPAARGRPAVAQRGRATDTGPGDRERVRTEDRGLGMAGASRPGRGRSGRRRGRTPRGDLGGSRAATCPGHGVDHRVGVHRGSSQQGVVPLDPDVDVGPVGSAAR